MYELSQFGGMMPMIGMGMGAGGGMPPAGGMTMPMGAMPMGGRMPMGGMPQRWGIVPYPPGTVVLPLRAHMPEHAGRAARVVEVVWNQPFYSVDFGTGQPHRWYAHSELVPAPGARPGQQVGPATMPPGGMPGM